MKTIEVVAAVIRNHQNEIFCAKRRNDGPLALKWEFPGGKIEADESHQDALVREIQEEFSSLISVKDFILTVQHDYPTFHITMHAYYAEVLEGELILNEHTDSKWLPLSQLLSLDWAAADLPIVHAISHANNGG
jgi:8-oxo-dGTP diphosphatase